MENETQQDKKIQHIKTKSECIYVHMPNGDFLNIHSFSDSLYITVWSINDSLKNCETTVVTHDKISTGFKNQTTSDKKKIYHYNIVSSETEY